MRETPTTPNHPDGSGVSGDVLTGRREEESVVQIVDIFTTFERFHYERSFPLG